ncbi:MAG: hypothetical protein WAM70_00915 [Pyrinomonadaceae bacterium]
MKPPVVLASLVLDLLLALTPPVVPLAFASPPVGLTLTPRSLFPATPVFAVAGRPGSIARPIVSAITGSVAVAPLAIRPVAPVSVVPATLFFATTFFQLAPLLLRQLLLIAALLCQRLTLLVVLATL